MFDIFILCLHCLSLIGHYLSIDCKKTEEYNDTTQWKWSWCSSTLNEEETKQNKERLNDGFKTNVLITAWLHVISNKNYCYLLTPYTRFHSNIFVGWSYLENITWFLQYFTLYRGKELCWLVWENEYQILRSSPLFAEFENTSSCWGKIKCVGWLNENK